MGRGTPFVCRVRWSKASGRLYRREFDPVFRAAVRRLDGKYGAHLMGVHVCGGPCGEHHSWDVLTQVCHHPTAPISRFGFGDGSMPMTVRFRRFLREKYGRDFPDAEVPSMDARLRLDVDGTWRDPAKSRRTIDYFECLNRVIVENLGHYAGLVKQESDGRLPTLAFYGYISDWDWAVECDHRAVSAALGLKSLDMLSAPHTYRRRGLGEDGQMRTYAASVACHGKFFISEGDDRTHLEAQKAKPDGYGHAKTPAEGEALACGFGDLADVPVVVRKRQEGHTSVFASIPRLSSDLLRRLYRAAGVHVYTDQDVVLSANRAWLMLHTNHADDYEIRLPRRCRRVVDVTTDTVVATGTDRFTRPLPKFATAVFLLDAE